MDYTESVIQSFQSGSTNEKITALQQLNEYVTKTRQASKEQNKKIFLLLQEALLDQSRDVRLLALTLINDLETLFKRDLDPFIGLVLPRIVCNLGDPEPSLRKQSHISLLNYIRNCQNFDPVLNAFLKEGFSNSNWQTRQKSINSFEGLILTERKLINIESNELLEIIENIIQKLNTEPNAVVMKACEQVLVSLRSLDIFPQLFNQKLSKSSLECLGKFLESKGHGLPKRPSSGDRLSPKSSKTITISNLATAGQSIAISNQKSPDFITNKDKASQNYFYSPQQQIDTKPVPTKLIGGKALSSPPNLSLEFDLFPKQVIENLLDENADWKIRSNAIEEMSAIVEQNINELMILQPHIEEFTRRVVVKLIMDSNFKICVTMLNILSKLLFLPGIREKSNLTVLVPNLVDKLADSKIAIRQLTNKILKELRLTTKGIVDSWYWYEQLFEKFKEKNSQVKEEALNLLAYFLFECRDRPETELLIQVCLELARLLYEENKPKIKSLAHEILLKISTSLLKQEEIKYAFLENLTSEQYDLLGEKVWKPNFADELTEDMRKSNVSRTSVSSRRTVNSSNNPSYLNEMGNTTTFIVRTATPRRPSNNNLPYQGNSQGDCFDGHETCTSIMSSSKTELQKSNSISCPTRPTTNQMGKEMLSFLSTSKKSDVSFANQSNSPFGDKNISFEKTNSIRLQKDGDKFEYVPTESRQTESGLSESRASNRLVSSYFTNGNFRVAGNTLIEISTASSTRSGGTYTVNSLENSSNTFPTNGKFKPVNPNGAQIGGGQSNNTSYASKTKNGSPYTNRVHSAETELSPKIFAKKDNEEARSTSAVDGGTDPRSEKKSYSFYRSNNQQRESSGKRNGSSSEEKKNEGLILEYSITKNLEEFSTNSFDKADEKINSKGQKLPKILEKPNFNSFNKNTGALNNVGIAATSSNSVYKEDQSSTLKNYKPPLGKKHSRKLTNEKIGDDLIGTNDELVVQSKEYQSRNPSEFQGNNSESYQQESSGGYRKNNVSSLRKKINTAAFANEEIAENDELKLEEENERRSDKSPLNKTSTLKKKKMAAVKVMGESIGPAGNLDYKQQNYTSYDELEPMTNPEIAFKNMMNEIKSDDWARHFEGLNVLRRLSKHHSDIIFNQNAVVLHAIVLEILRAIDSLRSCLAKNGMITLTEMLQLLKKGLDSEIELIITRLLKKASDNNAFISEEVKKGFTSVCQNCSDNKIMSCLFNMTNTKSLQGKINIVTCLEVIIEKNESRLISQIREIDKFLLLLTNFMFDPAVEVRTASRRAFDSLFSFFLNKNELEKILQRVLNETMFNKVKGHIDKLSSQNNTLIITNPSFNQKKSQIQAPNSKEKTMKGSSPLVNRGEDTPIDRKSNTMNAIELRKQDSDNTVTEKEINNFFKEKASTISKSAPKLKDPIEFDNFPLYFSMVENNDWKKRSEIIETLADLARKYPDNLTRNKNINKYVDCFLKLMNDSNSKVSCQACNCVCDILPILKPALESNINNVLTSLFNVIGSSNPSIKSAGENLLDSYFNYIDSSLLVQHMCNGALYGIGKARPIIIAKLNETIPTVNSRKPLIISKYVYPMIFKLMDENKPDLKSNLQKLIQTVNGLGSSFIEAAPVGKVQQINDIINK